MPQEIILNIEDLKGLELPVKVSSNLKVSSLGGELFYLDAHIITGFGKELVIVENKSEKETALHIDYFKDYELAPKTKTVVFDKKFLLFSDGSLIPDNNQNLNLTDIIGTIHIKRTYELDENNNIIDIKEG